VTWGFPLFNWTRKQPPSNLNTSNTLATTYEHSGNQQRQHFRFAQQALLYQLDSTVRISGQADTSLDFYLLYQWFQWSQQTHKTLHLYVSKVHQSTFL